MVGLVWLLFRFVSLYTVRAWGKSLARATRHVPLARFNVIRKNLELAFPEMDVAERERLAIRNLEETGAYLLETTYVHLHGCKTVFQNHEVRGRGVLEAALANGKNVLLIGAHYTCLDCCGVVMGHDVPVDVVVRHQNAAVTNYLISRFRRHHFRSAIHRDDRAALVHAFQDKSTQRIIWLAPDQDFGHRRSVFVPFLGVQDAATLASTSRIVQRYDLTPIFIEFSFDDDANKWVIEYQPIENFPTDDQVADAATLNRVIGASAQRHPHQYYWVHRRFKSLPDGSVRKYR